MAPFSALKFAYAFTLVNLAWTTTVTYSEGLSWSIGQTVHTSSGSVQGHASKNAPSVSEYLGIPYAKPPVGNLRWATPQNLNSPSANIRGSAFGYSCPSNGATSFAAKLPGLFKQNLTGSAIQLLDSLIGQTGDAFNEDCLTLNVWTKPQSGEKKKAVLLWIHGGSFNTGTSNIRAYNGYHLADTQDIIIVSINYRLNIFGFPGAPGITNNFGLLDQRLAIEWTRDNIHSFGGDPKRITLAGESAGAGSVDFYSFAWAKDPIVNGLILQSGIATPASSNASVANWLAASTLLGCNSTSAASSVLACMRSRDQDLLLKTITALPTFGPAVDNFIVFSDNIARALAGNFIRKPMLIGHNDNEIGLFRILFLALGKTLSDSSWTLQNLFPFNCGAALRAKTSSAKVTTWRYRYFGDFPNLALSKSPPSGAWHGAEIPMVFGTDLEVQNVTGRTAAQEQIGAYMQGAWAAYVKDPEDGLKRYGWPKYDPKSKTLIRLGFENRTSTNLASPADYDFSCPWIFTLGQALLNSASPQTAIDVLASLTRPVAQQVLALFEA
ncbi:related to acetylcholinesterase precursor [Rhynchosporium secalis]|uniref:Carboxylic ester hydrolase n=1 Tax=Rhynchosporium secalis TaxID=38038 RepID=A0A1E1MJP3_RHYSE|nr:related to acetylcholinesterase precursor [Rhynchosporium secalis]